MWLKQALEKRHLDNLQEQYSRADRRFMLRGGVQTFPSYTNPNNYHLIGYVEKAYNINGTTYLDVRTNNSDTLTITAPKYSKAESLEYTSVLCTEVVEHCNYILDNTIFERTCSKVIIL